MAQTGYNATLTGRIDINPAMMIVRVVPDAGVPPFRAGQYAVLGLTKSAERVPEAAPDDVAEADGGKLIRRAYSVSSASRQGEFYEFYITLVYSGELTPACSRCAKGRASGSAPRWSGCSPSTRSLPNRICC